MAPEVPVRVVGGSEAVPGVGADDVLRGWSELAREAAEAVALADLGSSLMNLENALELAGGGSPCPLRIADAPLVEGAVAAAMAAATGGAVDEVCEAAEAAWNARKRV